MIVPDSIKARERLKPDQQLKFDQYLTKILDSIDKINYPTYLQILFSRDINYLQNDFNISYETPNKITTYPLISTILSYLIQPPQPQQPLLHQPETHPSEFAQLKQKFNSLEIIDFLLQLHQSDLLDLLFIKQTAGSLFLNVLISRNFLLFNATKQLEKDPKRSQIQRGLSKHSQRSAFWGEIKGNYQQQNQAANDVLTHIIDNCVWLNYFKLYENVSVVELRMQNGKGARWHYSDEILVFRGLVEEFTLDVNKKIKQ